MVQGLAKNKGAKPGSILLKKSKSTAGKKTTLSSGKRIAPKNQQLIQQKAISKKLNAQNIRSLETVMAARAGSSGKLTVMKSVADKALKDAKKDAKEKAAKKKA